MKCGSSLSRSESVHITYAAVHDEDGEFQGVLEYVQDIQPTVRLIRTIFVD